jgi:hypothetical protein
VAWEVLVVHTDQVLLDQEDSSSRVLPFHQVVHTASLYQVELRLPYPVPLFHQTQATPEVFLCLMEVLHTSSSRCLLLEERLDPAVCTLARLLDLLDLLEESISIYMLDLEGPDTDLVVLADLDMDLVDQVVQDMDPVDQDMDLVDPDMDLVDQVVQHMDLVDLVDQVVLDMDLADLVVLDMDLADQVLQDMDLADQMLQDMDLADQLLQDMDLMVQHMDLVGLVDQVVLDTDLVDLADPDMDPVDLADHVLLDMDLADYPSVPSVRLDPQHRLWSLIPLTIVLMVMMPPASCPTPELHPLS